VLLPSHRGEDLEEICALNRLFIDFLAERARRGGDCLGLERAAVAALREATPQSLDTLVIFPRALFQVRLPLPQPLRVMDPPVDTREFPRYVLQVTILHSAWTLSRRNPYAARLYLGLEDRDVRELRALTLFDIPQVSASGTLVTCAFPHAAWLWRKLLTETHPESRRRLLLLALQPQAPTPRPLLHSSAQQLSA
jgi:hypothetical protein